MCGFPLGPSRTGHTLDFFFCRQATAGQILSITKQCIIVTSISSLHVCATTAFLLMFPSLQHNWLRGIAWLCFFFKGVHRSYFEYVNLPMNMSTFSISWLLRNPTQRINPQWVAFQQWKIPFQRLCVSEVCFVLVRIVQLLDISRLSGRTQPHKCYQQLPELLSSLSGLPTYRRSQVRSRSVRPHADPGFAEWHFFLWGKHSCWCV